MQARGRKRSGRANSGKSAAATKKPRGGMAAGGMRGLFSMQARQLSRGEVLLDEGSKPACKSGQPVYHSVKPRLRLQTASQGASDKDVKKKNSGRSVTTLGEHCCHALPNSRMMPGLLSPIAGNSDGHPV